MPGKLIDFLDLDVSGLNIGDSLHIRDIELPEGITTAEEDHLTVAIVAAPTVTPEAVEEEISPDDFDQPVEEEISPDDLKCGL